MVRHEALKLKVRASRFIMVLTFIIRVKSDCGLELKFKASGLADC